MLQRVFCSLDQIRIIVPKIVCWLSKCTYIFRVMFELNIETIEYKKY